MNYYTQTDKDLDFCMWLQENFDELVKELNVQRNTEQTITKNKEEVKENTRMEQGVSRRDNRQSTSLAPKQIDKQWRRGAGSFPTAKWLGLARDIE